MQHGRGRSRARCIGLDKSTVTRENWEAEMTNALQKATSSSPRRQSVRGSASWRALLQKSTCHGHLTKSFGRRNDRRSLTLQDLKVDLLLLLKQGSSVMNFLQWRPCPSARPSSVRPPSSFLSQNIKKSIRFRCTFRLPLCSSRSPLCCSSSQ